MCDRPKRFTRVQNYKDEDWSSEDDARKLKKKSRFAPKKQLACSTHQTLKHCVQALQSMTVAKKQNKALATSKKGTKHLLARKKIIPTLSEYELEVQKNIEERKKCFEMLQLGVAKQELLNVLPNQSNKKLENSENDTTRSEPPRKKGRPLGKRIGMIKKVKLQVLPERTSTRERKQTQFFDYEEEALATNLLHITGPRVCRKT